MLVILIIGLIAGPAVSLYGSPTVSPVIEAAWPTPCRRGRVLDQLLGVVRCSAARGHRDRQEDAGHDRPDQQAAQA